MKITIEQLKTVSPDTVLQINNLLAQLDSDSSKLNEETIKEIIESPSNYFFVAREPEDHKIVGMLTLVIYSVPARKKSWIEDVVVDEKYRGKGIATKLVNCAIEKARNNAAISLDLTSRPERENASKLYLKLGFSKRKTNVYRIKL